MIEDVGDAQAEAERWNSKGQQGRNLGVWLLYTIARWVDLFAGNIHDYFVLVIV